MRPIAIMNLMSNYFQAKPFNPGYGNTIWVAPRPKSLTSIYIPPFFHGDF